jgi:hypothetical protein
VVLAIHHPATNLGDEMTLDAYADLDTFRLYLRAAAVTSEADDPDSALEALVLEAASRAIDASCGRSFKVAAASPSARVFTAYGYQSAVYPFTPYVPNWHYTLPIDDVVSTTGMIVATDSTGNGDYTNVITDYRVGPANAQDKGIPYTLLIFDTGVYPPTIKEGVQVTALWGWDAVPNTIVQATLMQAARFIKRRDAAFGVAGSPEMGAQIRLLSRIDPDVAVVEGAYRKNWGAA